MLSHSDTTVPRLGVSNALVLFVASTDSLRARGHRMHCLPTFPSAPQYSLEPSWPLWSVALLLLLNYVSLIG